MSELRVNTVVNSAGSGAPELTYGVSLPVGYGITGTGGVNVGGPSTIASSGGITTCGGDLFAGDSIGVLKDIKVGAAATITGALSGSTGTFSGAVNVEATTDSTSTTTGALIVDGGAAIAKNVYIGAGLSVAGTLTYEDVTSVDSVGLITAKSGVNVSGGQLQVGVAYSVGAAGVATAAGFVGPAPSGWEVSGGEFKVGTAVTISSTSGVGTFSKGVNVPDSQQLRMGDGEDLLIQHNGTNSFIDNNTGDLYLQTTGSGDDILIQSADDIYLQPQGGEDGIQILGNGEIKIYYDGSKKWETTNDGVSITGMSTVTTGAHFQGMLREDCNIVANKLSAGTNIDLEDGMMHYYSTNETTTATPNIRWNSSYSLNNKMSTGEVVTVTIIYKPNNAGYYAALTVDGSGVTEEWNGGSAPSSANAGGYDVLTHTLVKIADASFICLSNVQNYA